MIELQIKYYNDLNKLEALQRQKEQAIDQAKIKASQDRIAKIQTQENELDDNLSRNILKLLDEKIEAMDREVLADKEKIRALLNQADQLSSAILGGLSSLSQINNNRAERDLQNAEKKSDEEATLLEKQYKAQLISKDEYERRKEDINKRAYQEEVKIKRRQFEADKNIALIQTSINIAQAVAKAYTMGGPFGIAYAAIIAGLGAIQVAAIARHAPPKFEKGGEVKGKRHSQGGVLIEAEDGEMITRRDQALKNYPLLKAVNDGQAESFIRIHYIAPALKEQKAKYDRMITLNNKQTLQTFRDENIVDGLKMTRAQARENALFIVKELKGSNSRSPHKW